MAISVCARRRVRRPAGRSPWTKTVSGYFQLAAVAGRAVIKRASGLDAWERRSSQECENKNTQVFGSREEALEAESGAV